MGQCRAFTTTSNDGLLRVLCNNVYVSDPITTRLVGKPLEKEPETEYKAIWDTGATCTAITERVVKECGLIPISVANVHHAGGVKQVNVYVIDLWLPNYVIIRDLQVTEAIIRDADLLIGMDVIGKGDFAVSNFQGKTMFTYRCPSMESISFVKKVNTPVRKGPKIGRNEPCPCGSGKKYKHCCGR